MASFPPLQVMLNVLYLTRPQSNRHNLPKQIEHVLTDRQRSVRQECAMFRPSISQLSRTFGSPQGNTSLSLCRVLAFSGWLSMLKDVLNCVHFDTLMSTNVQADRLSASSLDSRASYLWQGSSAQYWIGLAQYKLQFPNRWKDLNFAHWRKGNTDSGSRRQHVGRRNFRVVA